MNSKQLHVLIGLLCVAALAATPFVFVGLKLPSALLPVYLSVVLVAALANQIALVGILHREKDEQDIKIGLGYGLFCVLNVLFLCFSMVVSSGSIILYCWTAL